MAGGEAPLPKAAGYRRVRGLPQVSSGGDAPGGWWWGSGRAAPTALPAWEVPENVRPGQSWGAGGRGGRSPAPLPPSPDKWAAGRRRAGGRRQPVDERGPPGPVPSPAAPSAPCRRGRPGAPPHVNGRIPRGAGGNRAFLPFPGDRLDGRGSGRARGPGGGKAVGAAPSG